MLKKILKQIKLLISRKVRVKDLQKQILQLEEENASLKNTVVDSMNMVTTYKDSMVEMKKFMNHLVQLGTMEISSNNIEENEEEEEEFDRYALLRKKNNNTLKKIQ